MSDERLDKALKAYRPRVAGFIAKMAPGADVDDLTQETLLNVAKGFRGFAGESALSSWIFRIASNVCVDYFRSEASKKAVSIENIESPCSPPSQEPYTAVARDQMSACVQARIMSMSRAYSDIVFRHDIEGRKLSEIAAIDGSSVGAVKTRLHRARKKLRAVLQSACDLTRDERNALTCSPKNR